MNLDRIIYAALFTPGLNDRWGLPLLFEGEPGVAKTARIMRVSESAGLYGIALLGAVRDPADFSGFPVPDGEVVRMAAPAFAEQAAAAGGRSVIFCDELTSCPPAVQAAMLRVILDGAVGDYILPKTVRFIAACNPVGIAANGFDLSAPLANRFGHLPWPAPTMADWTAYMLGGGEKPTRKRAEDVEDEVMRAWPTAYASARGQVIGFLSAQPTHLHRMPPANDPRASKAWPSPRTWEMATRALAGARVHGLSDADTMAFVSAFVGEGSGAAMFAFIRDADLPSTIDLLEGRATWVHDHRRVDRTLAVMASCAALTIAEPSEARTTGFWTVAEAAVKGGAPDAAMSAVLAVIQSPGTKAVRSPKFAAVMAHFRPIMQKAGVLPAGS
jgi:MoxR-like ATPase